MDVTPADLVLRPLGAFYGFAGLVALRAAVMGGFIDRALAALSMKRTPRAERIRQIWLTAAPVGIGAGGFALIMLWDWAVVLFIVNALAQAVYLVIVAPRYLDPEDPPDAKGRRSTWNAFLLYLVATAGVIWAGHAGTLRPFEALHPALLAIAIFCFVFGYGMVLRQLVDRPGGGNAIDGGMAPEPVPARLILTPSWGGTGLIDAETGLPWETWEQRAYLPEDLTARLLGWIDLFQSRADAHDPRRAALLDPAAQAGIDAAGAALLPAVRAALPDTAISFEPAALPVPPARDLDGGVMLVPALYDWPLRSLAPADEALPPDRIGISWQLTLDLNAWSEEYDRAEIEDLPPWTPARLAAYHRDAGLLADRLRREFAATGRPDLRVEISDPLAALQ
ncbi:hypothetical protein [Zavarzinia compransoris]|uniref:Uncharacterized protein n=1 Tax=Zavarzinia compransoris TaxID=1264899 RepID=A0A317EBD6_9PROT|nr:hypothetical protein [Zavarzinia compransoris]PWR23892.1 hypothetical protein DKG75_04905 [Zavarzinia compransoris]TDP48136.1 hypothetical protein DES42_102438 [Zavarzinia compransoris]